MVLKKVSNCPDTFLKWKLSSKQCSNTEHYHCVLNESSNFVEGCIKPIWIEPGFCPVYNTIALKLDSQKCKDAECSTSTFRSFQIYQYPECLSQGGLSLDTTSVSNPYSSTTNTSTTTGSSSSPVSIILPSVLVPLFVLLSIAIVVTYMYFKRKKNKKRGFPWYTAERRADRKVAEEENSTLLNMDAGFSSENTSVQNNEQKREAFLNSMNVTTNELYEDMQKMGKVMKILKERRTVALIGERGSGKRTIAMQLALRLEAEQNELQFKVLHDFHSLAFTIPSIPTVIIIPELYKTWYTNSHMNDIMKWLAMIYSHLEENRCYVIATLIESTWASFANTYSEHFDRVFPQSHLFTLQDLKFTKATVSFIAKKHHKIFNNEFSSHLSKDVFTCAGKPLQALFYCKIPLDKKLWNDPIAAIMLDLGDMANSTNMCKRFDYLVLVYIMLHNGCIEKKKLLEESEHDIFNDILRGMVGKNFFQGRVDNLLSTYLVSSIDGKYYKIIHDVVVRCLFIFTFKTEHFDLLCNECDPYLLLDCIRLKTMLERVRHKGEFIVDCEALKIGIPSEKLSKIAEVFRKRQNVVEISRIANFFEEKEFLKVWHT